MFLQSGRRSPVLFVALRYAAEICLYLNRFPWMPHQASRQSTCTLTVR